MNTDSIIKGSNGTVFIDGKYLSPEKSQEVYNHSPDGFNWGYGGSGPSQLALALLLEFLSKDNALRSYQEFKWDIIAGLPKDFEITGKDIMNWIEKHAF